MRRERLYLEDIVTAADAIAEFIQGQDPNSLEANRMLRSAVAHQLMIIGEAAARISSELRERYEDVPWPDIVGLRNIIVHGYFGIDWREVWRAAAEDVPVLRAKVAGILRMEFPK